MKKPVLSIATVLLLCAPPMAQAAESPSGSSTDIIEEIMASLSPDMMIAPDKRDDLSNCNATEGQALVDAVHKCWPVQKPWHEMMKLIMSFQPRSDDEAAGMTEISLDLSIETADKLIAMSEARDWPAQDITLVLGHTMYMERAQKTGDLGIAIDRLDRIIGILQTSKITDAGFTDTAELEMTRQMLAAESSTGE